MYRVNSKGETMKKAILGLILSLVAASLVFAAPSVTITWTASTGTGITGYNVYRITGVCPSVISLSAFTKLTATPQTALTYTDTTVVDGGSYCYTVTALTSTQESAAPGTLAVSIPLYTASTAPPPPGAPTAGNITQ
jgi:fibronectin type 3 domain-containing protein